MSDTPSNKIDTGAGNAFIKPILRNVPQVKSYTAPEPKQTSGDDGNNLAAMRSRTLAEQIEYEKLNVWGFDRNTYAAHETAHILLRLLGVPSYNATHAVEIFVQPVDKLINCVIQGNVPDKQFFLKEFDQIKDVFTANENHVRTLLYAVHEIEQQKQGAPLSIRDTWRQVYYNDNNLVLRAENRNDIICDRNKVTGKTWSVTMPNGDVMYRYDVERPEDTVLPEEQEGLFERYNPPNKEAVARLYDQLLPGLEKLNEALDAISTDVTLREDALLEMSMDELLEVFDVKKLMVHKAEFDSEKNQKIKLDLKEGKKDLTRAKDWKAHVSETELSDAPSR